MKDPFFYAIDMFSSLFKISKPQPTTELEKPVVSASPPAEPNNQVETHAIALPLEFLKKLIPIAHLTPEQLQQLTIRSATFPLGSIIFKRGSQNDFLIYLIKGEAYLEADNGAGQGIIDHTLQAYYPLSNGAEHQLTAIAKSEVTVIYIAQTAIPPTPNKVNPLISGSAASEQLENNAFFKLFSYHLEREKLNIPSIPDIALKLNRAIQKDIGTAEAAKIISLDPAITSKLIHFTNSPLYRTLNPAFSCLDAVNRLGLSTTRNIVTSLSMQSLFKSDRRNINARIQSLWKESVRVSSISHTLAILSQKTDPEEALLAGLLHNLGALPILKFAEKLNDATYEPDDLDQCLSLIQGHLGALILESWGFPEGLAKVPVDIESWYHDGGKAFTLSDIVLLAKFHSLIGTKGTSALPLITTLPAYQKLGNNMLSPDMSLQVLHDAKQQISDAMDLFIGQ